MSLQRITDSLAVLFASHPIVFWHDSEGEFSATLDNLALDNVNLVRLQETPALQIKMAIERQPDQYWLLYSTQPEPDPDKDWLLDIRLRSKSFKADSTSILLDDLGLVSQTLRGHLKERARFLRAKERVERLKRLVVASDNAGDLDRKMLAVLTRADQPELFSILQRLFATLVVDGEVNLNAQPKIWQDIIANDLEDAFWLLAKTQLGYAETEPSLRDLLFRILVTDFSRSLLCEPVEALKHFVLPERNLAANASVFALRWRSDLAHYTSYNLITAVVGRDLELVHLLSGLSADELSEVMTFEEVERRIISDLRHFNRATEFVEPMGWAVLHELKQRIEAAYSGWFIPQLSSAWAKILEGEAGLLSSWRIPGSINQQNFFDKVVLPLSDGGTKRVFVIISDAFRFEVAEELVQVINSKSRIKAALSSVLGVLPSYTGLGMASLLPHQTLTYKINSSLELMADGKPVSSMDQRSAYLAAYSGAAIKAEDLLAMGKDKGREFVRERRLLYIYHDRIDLIGDKQCFDAAERRAVTVE